MAAPRTKRQFAGAALDPAQRQITSFFNANSTTPRALNSNSEILEAPVSLPESVQANLLSVGMRIRKSVPEGYKTGNYSAFALWDETNEILLGADAMGGESGRSRANAISTPRELLPFCGIHKVGGMDVQPPSHSVPQFTFSTAAGSPSSPPYQPSFDAMDEMGLPGLSSSQESAISTDSVLSMGPSGKARKRFFTEEDEDILETSGRLTSWGESLLQDGEISPRSLTPRVLGNGRVFAMPRKGRFRGKLGTSNGWPAVGQENVMIADTDADFEEAGFLDRSTDLGYRRNGWEVEMSDV